MSDEIEKYPTTKDLNLELKPDAMPPNTEEEASGNQNDQELDKNNTVIVEKMFQLLSVSPKPTAEMAQEEMVDEKKLIPYLQSPKKLTKVELQQISKSLGGNWRPIGRYLGIDDAELDVIYYDHKLEGCKEIGYQMLKHWFEKEPSLCTVGNLAKAFEGNDNFKLILQLPLE